ncbi:hypothetical protein F4V57_10450 [Acinetobacter qingfengensis]|uniref:Uncharacterized protein n=1 Tax=Acinetobacter qingfengensis TaxID=1262585 RepID=A0A1E7RCR1_9GAMM|nr:hypothetical protein [Acinetobacter qingfengensis]KAA8732039.1 hypothetical protein F4V57_10450 [Acinetobacter qingfengensis]OEY97121.1 hypothetical protein BJI46_01430 [Acinetobacter qingfengensis]
MSSSEKEIKFKTKIDFTQAAFNEVARIVSQQGQQILDCLSPALNTQQCLEHLAYVAAEYSYDYSIIDAHVDVYKKTNAEFLDCMDEYKK